MKTFAARWLERFSQKQIEREVDEELQFHVEMLTQMYVDQGMQLEKARLKSSERFGDYTQAKEQCVEISLRNGPIMKAMKILFVASFLLGVWIRIIGTDFNVKQMGDVMMMIGVGGGLLTYAKMLGPRLFRSKSEYSPLGLRDIYPPSTYDEFGRTPFERIKSDSE